MLQSTAFAEGHSIRQQQLAAEEAQQQQQLAQSLVQQPSLNVSSPVAAAPDATTTNNDLRARVEQPIVARPDAARERANIDRWREQKHALQTKENELKFVSWQQPLDDDEAPSRKKNIAPPTADQIEILERFQDGKKSPEDVVRAFGGRMKIVDYLGANSPLPAELRDSARKAALRFDLQNYATGREQNRQAQTADQVRYEQQRIDFNKSIAGKTDAEIIRRIDEIAKRADLAPQMQQHLREYRHHVYDRLTNDKLHEFSALPPNAAVDRAFEFADQLQLSEPERAQFVDRLAQRVGAGDERRVNQVQARAAIRELAEADRDQSLPATDFALKSLDKAAELAGKNFADAAAEVLENQAAAARARFGMLASDSPNRVLLDHFAAHADAQAAAFRAVAPKAGHDAADRLYQTAAQAEKAAAELDKDEHFEQARALQTMARSAALQAVGTHHAATNTKLALSNGVLDGYRKIAEASFDKKIAEARTWAYPWQDKSPADQLRDQKKMMQGAFDELERTMRQKNLSLDKAWDDMNKDHSRLDDSHPLRQVGYGDLKATQVRAATRAAAAEFIKENAVTKGLLSPFAQLAEGLNEGDNGKVDQASKSVIEALKANDQWNIAEQLTKSFRENALTPEGKRLADDLANRENWDWFKAKSAEFARDELPLLVLSGVASGGVGWGAKALTTAAKLGPKIARGVQGVSEAGSFLFADRLLKEGLAGQKAEWSGKSFARDAAFGAAFFLGGKALGKFAGAAWETLRVHNFGVPSRFQQLRGRLAGMNDAERKLLDDLNNPALKNQATSKGAIELDAVARLTRVTKSEIALLRNKNTGESLLLKGNRDSIPQLTEVEMKRLAAEGWELQAHSHLRDLRASKGDAQIVAAAGQESSVIVNQRGKWLEFVPEDAFGGKVGQLSAGAAPSAKTAANWAKLRQGHWIGKEIAVDGKLPAGYYWREGDIYRKAGKVEADFVPLRFEPKPGTDGKIGTIVLREGIERMSIPSVMNREFKAQLAARFAKEVRDEAARAKKTLTPTQLEQAVEKRVAAEAARVQIHHLIPDEMIQKHELGKLARQQVNYNVDRQNNLLGLGRTKALARSRGEIGHWTSHPKYTRLVKKELDDTYNQLKTNYLDKGKPIPDKVLRDEMQRIEDHFRNLIKTRDKTIPTIDGRLANLTPQARWMATAV